jgi:UDP-glucose 4-epimerase
MRVGITGASGFVGRALMASASQLGFTPIAIVRRPSGFPDEVVIDDMTDPNGPIPQDLMLNSVVHLFAKTHDGTGDKKNEVAFRKINVDGTRWALNFAKATGADRFVFLSSIKVMGEQTILGSPFTEKTHSSPEDIYGLTKLEAENVVRESGISSVVLRSPLVYGPNAKGNFRLLTKLAQSGIPLPFASIQNRRSLIGLDNLCSAILTCCAHPAADGKIYLVSDGKPISTPELLRQMAIAQQRPIRLIPFPPVMLSILAKIVGKSQISKRLLSSLEIDSRAIERDLGWEPVVTVAESLQSINRN